MVDDPVLRSLTKITLFISLFTSLYALDVLPLVSGLCFVFVWLLFRTVDGPPVIQLALSVQWAQTSFGLYYVAFTNRDIIVLQADEYRLMVLVGLGSVLAIAGGLRLGIALLGGTTPVHAQTTRHAFTLNQLLRVYIFTFLIEGILYSYAWQFTQFNQVLLVLSSIHLVLLFLIFQSLLRRERGIVLLSILLGIEILIGLTGFFAGFRESIFMALIALTENAFVRKRVHWGTVTTLVFALFFTSLLWTGIKMDTRQDYYSRSQWERATFTFERSVAWLQSPTEIKLLTADKLVERIWHIYYPALALERVPDRIDHTNGELTRTALRHIFMPRILFPDKPPLPSDSEMVRKYSGVWVAGAESKTSIAFGYSIELYVDYGIPIMFVPMFIFGGLLGFCYSFLRRVIYYNQISSGFIVLTFWLALYLFERSWIRTLGLGFTYVIVLGTLAIVIDNVLRNLLPQLHRTK